VHRVWPFVCFTAWPVAVAFAQVDPISRNQLQLGYDYPITRPRPQALYAYYYLNIPEFTCTNLALRLAIAPAYLDGELGIRGVITPWTDLGIGIAGGAYGDYYYEVRQGHYFKEESFDGHGGGASVSLYHRLNPQQRVPLNVVARGGFRYSTYLEADKTSPDFELPGDRWNPWMRAGLRLAGKEPVLYPDLGFEVSVWFERQWRLESDEYGFANDRSVNASVDLYWLYAGLDYAWTNAGQKISVGVTAGGSDDTDRFGAWRLGGMLPLVAEFPLVLPGYYFQEISARRFVHMQAAYTVSLAPQDRWGLRVDAATARVDYLRGTEEPAHWHTGVGGGIVFTSRSRVVKVAIRYGYGFNALRKDEEGAHSVCILFQYDFEALIQRYFRRS
jgi:hypothetical protein